MQDLFLISLCILILCKPHWEPMLWIRRQIHTLTKAAWVIPGFLIYVQPLWPSRQLELGNQFPAPWMLLPHYKELWFYLSLGIRWQHWAFIFCISSGTITWWTRTWSWGTATDWWFCGKDKNKHRWVIRKYQPHSAYMTTWVYNVPFIHCFLFPPHDVSHIQRA